MNEQKSKKARTHPVNYILLAASLIIFGSLGLVFITQMELQPGWLWEEVKEENSMEISAFEGDDLNIEKDGIIDVIAYSDVVRQDDRKSDDPNDVPNYGKIFALDGLTGVKIWEKDCENPVKRVFVVMDVNEDGYEDYFADIASVGPSWIENPSPYNDELQPEIIFDAFSNILIYGNNGSDIPILTGDHRSFTNFFIHDLAYLDGLNDNKPDLVFLECVNKSSENSEYKYNISSYFVNGTKFSSFYIDYASIWKESGVPALQLFRYDSQDHLLFLDRNKIMLLNTSALNFLDPIYNETLMENTIDYTITEDLNGDFISEIIVTTNEGNISIISGGDGNSIRMFNLPRELEYNNYRIETINSTSSDQEAFIIISGDYGEDNLRASQNLIYTITGTSETIFRT